MLGSDTKTRIDRLSVIFLVSLFAFGSVAQHLKKVDSNASKSSGKTGEEWLIYGLDFADTRYSPLKKIDRTNVGRLGLEWAYDIPADGDVDTA